MASQQFCLRWSNYQTNLLAEFDDLLLSESLVDCTLACDGESLKAHKIVLAACSPFFQQLFKDNPCKHPIVIIKDIAMENLKAIIHFMYKGEVNAPQEQLVHLLKAAETLRVKGLAELTVNQRRDMTSVVKPIVSTNIGTFAQQTLPKLSSQPLQAISLQQPMAPIIVPTVPICSPVSVPFNNSPPLERINERVPNENELAKTIEENETIKTVKEENDDENAAKEMDSIELDSLPQPPSSSSASTMCGIKDECPKEAIENPSKSQGDDSSEAFLDPSTLVEQMLSVQMQPNLLGGSSQDEPINSPESNTATAKPGRSKERKRHTAMYDSCPICHKEFANHNNYIARQHMALHAEVPVRFRCDVCSKSFRWRNNLYVHRKKYHPGMPPPSSAHVNIVISESPCSTSTTTTVSNSTMGSTETGTSASPKT